MHGALVLTFQLWDITFQCHMNCRALSLLSYDKLLRSLQRVNGRGTW